MEKRIQSIADLRTKIDALTAKVKETMPAAFPASGDLELQPLTATPINFEEEVKDKTNSEMLQKQKKMLKE